MERRKEIIQRIGKDVKYILPSAALLAVLWILCNFLFGAVCPSVVFLGLPCPGCGLTRAAACLFTGRWTQSLQYNPMTVFWLAGGAYYLFMRYVKGRRAKGMTALIILLSVMSVAVFAVRMYLYFPGEEPLAYHSGNLTERILPAYGEWMERYEN